MDALPDTVTQRRGEFGNRFSDLFIQSAPLLDAHTQLPESVQKATELIWFWKFVGFEYD